MSYKIATLKRDIKGKTFSLDKGTKVYVVQENERESLVRLTPESTIEYPIGNTVLNFNRTPLAQLYDRKDALYTDVLAAIRKAIGRKKKVDFGQNGFEDDAGNDLVSVDKDWVYFESGNEKYELAGLSLEDALNVLQTITNESTI